MKAARSILSGRNRLVLAFAGFALLLGLASCSRFKTMWLCTKSCACSDDKGDGAGGTGSVDPRKALAAAKNPAAAGKMAGKGAIKDGVAGAKDGTGGTGDGPGDGSGADGAEGKPAGDDGSGSGDDKGSGSGDDDDDDDDDDEIDDLSAGPREGTLMLAKNLRLMGAISGGSVKMIKNSNDKIYIFYYEADRRPVIETLEDDESYDVTYKVKRKCPGESDFCGTFITADER